MAWTIEYLNATKRQLKRLDPKASRRILEFMSERVAKSEDPYLLGHALTGRWSGFWRYRVGDYRMICKIQHEELIVLVVKAGHRSDVYTGNVPGQ